MLLDSEQYKNGWHGTAQDLLVALNSLKRTFLPDTDRAAWVPDVTRLSGRITRLEDSLTAQGYIITRERLKDRRIIHITKAPVTCPLTEVLANLSLQLQNPLTAAMFQPETIQHLKEFKPPSDSAAGDSYIPIRGGSKVIWYTSDEGYLTY